MILLYLIFNIFASAEMTSKIEMEWDAVPMSAGYDVELKDESGKILNFKKTEPSLTEEVPIGLYKVRIRSIRKDQKVGKWSAPMAVEALPLDLVIEEPGNEAQLIAGTERGRIVKFRWKARAGLKKFYFRLWTSEGEVKTALLDKKEIDLELKPGITYYWIVTARSESGVVYDNSDQAFSFMIIGDRLPPPFEIDLQDSIFSWTLVEKAASYKIQIDYRYLDEVEWTTFYQGKQKATEIPFDFLPTREYRIRVISESPTRLPSLPADRQFFVKPKS